MKINRKLTERRKLARETRRALSVYLYFLTPDARKDYSDGDIIARQRVCLNAAQQALGDLVELNADIKGYEE